MKESIREALSEFESLIKSIRHGQPTTIKDDLEPHWKALANQVIQLDDDSRPSLNYESQPSDGRRGQGNNEPQSYFSQLPSEDLLTLIKNTPHGLLIINPQSNRIEAINQTLLDHLGYERDNILGKPLQFFDYGLGNSLTKGEFREILASEGPLTVHSTYVDADGSPFPVELTLNKVSLKGEERILATARKISDDQALRYRLDSVTDQMPGVAYQFRVTSAGKYVFDYMSQGYEELSGTPRNRALKNFDEAIENVHPDDRKDLMESIKRVTRDVTPWKHEYRYRLPDGDVRWALGHSTPEELPDGSVLFSGVLIDITEKKNTEEALKRSERKFRQMAENIDQVFWIRDLESGDMIYISPAYEAIWHRDPETVLEDPSRWLKSVHPDDRERVKATIESTRGDDYEIEYRILRPEGEVRWVEDRGYAIRDESGKVEQFTGVATDITKRKQAEKEQEKIVDIVESTGDFIARATLDGTVTYLNNAALGFLPSNRKEDFIGNSVESLFPSYENDKLATVMETLENCGSWFGEIDFKNKQGSDPLRTAMNVFLVRDPDTDEPVEYAAIATDITEQIKTQDRLEETIAEKEALMRELHHRVKNNLQIISSLLRMQSRKDSTEDPEKVLEESRRRIQSMALLHERLYKSGDVKEVNFKKYVRDLLQSLETLEGVPGRTVSIERTVEVETISLDLSIPLGLIINELVTNALTHGVDDKQGFVQVEFGRDEDQYHLTVIDSGGNLPGGFDPDTQNSLGIRLVKSLTENQLGGTLEFSADSETVFSVTVPVESNG